MPYWVIFLNPWPDIPVFHRFGKRTFGLVEFTKCGREISTYKPWFPMKHAVRFGRPCKGCFPA